jgi:YVTN family beta-propeller protein
MRVRLEAMVLAALLLAGAPLARAEEAALSVEAKIPLGAVKGRIDHMAADVARRRVFVAELGNDSLGVVDVAAGKVLRTVDGLAEPQGVGYAAQGDMVYVANARDGSVRLFAGEGLAPAGRLDLGDDADNVRVDAATGQVVVGYGKGALALVDPVRRAKIGEIRLAAHPEAFQLGDGGRAFVNLPDARQVAVVDRAAGKVVASWPTGELRQNFPMALADGGQQVVVVFRRPAVLAVFAAASGAVVAKLEVCGDADDVFEDAQRRRLYVSCGEGYVDVLERGGEGYRRVQRLATAAGARTALFVPELDRLYVGVRGTASERPALWVLRPAP